MHVPSTLNPLIALCALATAACSSPPPCAAASGRDVIVSRCNSCHSSALVGPAARTAATTGVDFDTDGDVRKHADRIRLRAITTPTMPPDAPIPACESALL